MKKKLIPIIRNIAQCAKCLDIIESKHRHDFVSCKCGAITVDGGNDYWKRSGNPEDFMEVKDNALQTKKDR